MNNKTVSSIILNYVETKPYKILKDWFESLVKADYLYSEVTIQETTLNNKDIRFVEKEFSTDIRIGITSNPKNSGVIEDNVAGHELCNSQNRTATRVD